MPNMVHNLVSRSVVANEIIEIREPTTARVTPIKMRCLKSKLGRKLGKRVILEIAPRAYQFECEASGNDGN
jgi:hypothetical protein